MPLFKSLRSKSRKGSFGGASEVGSIAPSEAAEPNTHAHAVTTDARLQAAPPLSPSATAVSLEKKKSKLFSSGSVSGRRKNSHSQGDVPAGRPSLSTNISTSGQLFGGRSYSKSGHGTGPASSPPRSPSSPPPPLPLLTSGPKPSDLFAGKGRQWGEIDGGVPSGSAAATGTAAGSVGSSGSVGGGDAKADDLQNFLKARRQWVPTFVTEFKDEPDVKPVSKPDDIAFSSVPQTGSLMSLKDLDESHQRKQKLLGGSFLTSSTRDGSDWLATTSAGPSTGASTSAPPPSAAGRAIAINTAATATASTPLSTVTGGPPVVVNATTGSSTSSSSDTTTTRGKKSGSINRKPVPAVAPTATNGDASQHVNGNPSSAETAATATSPTSTVPTLAPAAAAAATAAALNGAPSASTGGFVDASEPAGSAPPQQQETTPLAQTHAHPRASMETSGTGAFQTPDASAPQSEVGHFVSMSKSPSAASAAAGNGNPIAELNQSIRGSGGAADETTAAEVVPAQGTA